MATNQLEGLVTGIKFNRRIFPLFWGEKTFSSCFQEIMFSLCVILRRDRPHSIACLFDTQRKLKAEPRIWDLEVYACVCV